MSDERARLGLPIGANVGRYRVRQVHAEWGFYLTYLAEDTGTNQLVLLHELLPEELVQRAADGTVSGRTEHTQESLAWARERFLAEGRALAACPHPAIQKILDVFEAHGTAYWVTPAEEGHSFKQWLQDLGHLPAEAELRPVLEALLSALAKVHAAGLQHLNLKPETIRMTANGQPFLAHFASSRQAIAQHSHAASAVTTGYSPIEQYEPDKTEGPWTDIYSLGAVLHRAVTGKAPPEATLRTPGAPYQKLAGRLPGAYSAQFLSAIDAALAPDATARPQSIEGWGKMLGMSGETKAPSFVQRHPGRAVAGAAAAIVLLGVVLWRVLHPTPAPILPKDDPAQKEKDRQAEIAKKKEKAKEEKKKADEQKKAEAEKKAEEARTAELQKKIEEQKKAEEERQAAETSAKEKAAVEKQAEEAAAKRAEEATEAEQSAEAEKAAAKQAAKKVEEAKSAAKKKAAEKEAAAAAEKAQEAQDKADQAALEQAATGVIAKKAGVDRAAAEQTAAEKAAAQKSIEEQIARATVGQKAAAEKAAVDQAAAQKVAAEKAAAEQTAQKATEEKAAAQQAAEKMAAEEKGAAERLAAAIAAHKEKQAKAKPHEKSEAEKAAEEIAANKPDEEKAAAEMAGKKAAEEKAAAEKTAAEKAGAEKAGKKAAEEKAAAEKAAAEKAAAEMAGKKTAEEKAAAEKAAAEKAAAETAGKKTAEEKAAAEKTAAEKAAAETTGKKAAEKKAAAEKAAAEKAAAEKAAAEKEAEEQAKTKAAQNSGGPPPPSGGGGGEVGSGLGGVWETTQKNANGQPMRKLIIYPDSHYELSGDVTDTGFVSAKLGIIGMNSRRAVAPQTSTFKYKTMSLIETDGALGKFEWVRTSPEAPKQNKEQNK